MFSGLTMANFGGHAIPGTFFLFYGFWLTVKHIRQHYWRTSQPKGRQNMPPFLKRMEYFEGGLQIFAAFVGQFSSQSSCTLTAKSLNLFSTHVICLMSSCHRHHGWTVCGGRAACPPLRQGEQLVGQADELAAQHHVSVLWDRWNSTGCQHCVQTGAIWCWPLHSLLGSFCWR